MSASSALTALASWYGRRDLRPAGRETARDGMVIACVGADVPRELIGAAGGLPLRMAAEPRAPTPAADAMVGATGLGWRGRSLLEQLLDPERSHLDGICIAHETEEHPRLFAILRELARQGTVRLPPVHFVDLLHLPGPATVQYNRCRLAECREWLATLSGRDISDADLHAAIVEANQQRAVTRRLSDLRLGDPPRLTGVQALAVVGAAAALAPGRHIALVEELLDGAAELSAVGGMGVLVSGSSHETPDVYELVEAAGALVIGEDHDWGEAWFADEVEEQRDGLTALAQHCLQSTPNSHTGGVAERVARLAGRAGAIRPYAVIHVSMAGDDAAPWEAAAARSALAHSGIPLLALRVAPDIGKDDPAHRARVREFLDHPETARSGLFSVGAADPLARQVSDGRREGTGRGEGERPAGQRSHKSLGSLAGFGAYQREWFAGLRDRVAAGEPFAVVNADAPHEIFRAMDIPYVVSQWWSSIAAAKQRTAHDMAVLIRHGYPDDVEPYSCSGLAAALEAPTGDAPWGGLPRPSILHAILGTDATRNIFETWAGETGATFIPIERSIESRWDIDPLWWDELPERWDQALEGCRLDLMTEGLVDLIRVLEQKTGRCFPHDRFVHVMELANEQEEYYRRTRDLIARTAPAPVSVVDTMPATMIPQWHRGTEWGRDAAKAFFEEVSRRVDAGDAAVPDERVRLMWVGRGLWNDMGFYQRFEQSHGAVFVWSMYLGLAADGYVRRFDNGRDPLRALAARFLTMGDELRMPTWAGAWYVKEAALHGVDGAVAIQDSSPLALRTLEASGVPVLVLPIDNFDRRGEEALGVESRVAQFIEGLVAARSRRSVRPAGVRGGC